MKISRKDQNYNKNWWARNQHRTLYHSAKARAKKLGLPFDLDISDIIIPDVCPYFKIKLGYRTGNNFAATLDRIDSSGGYTKGNIEVISMLANRMKSNASKEQLVQFAEVLLERYKPE